MLNIPYLNKRWVGEKNTTLSVEEKNLIKKREAIEDEIEKYRKEAAVLRLKINEKKE